MTLTDLLAVEGLTKTFGGVVAVSDVALSVGKDEVLGIIGPNGAGKSTLLNVVAGFYPQTKGTVKFKGDSIDGLPAFRRSHLGIARTFQKPTVFPNLTALDCVASAQSGKRQPTVWGAVFGRKAGARERKDRLRKAELLLDRVGLLSHSSMLASSLSHGDQMLLQLAVALSNDPELLLLDEPGSGLNPTELEKLRLAIQSFNREGVTITLVEHRMELVMTLCHRIAVLNKGEKIAEGKPTHIQNHPGVIEAYLGAKGRTRA